MIKGAIEKNNLKQTRIELGLTLTALSKLANVSSKIISQTERCLVNPTQVTKNKIVIGLNEGAGAFGRKWKYEEIFPHDADAD